jgi:hypothetical protein
MITLPIWAKYLESALNRLPEMGVYCWEVKQGINHATLFCQESKEFRVPTPNGLVYYGDLPVGYLDNEDYMTTVVVCAVMAIQDAMETDRERSLI